MTIALELTPEAEARLKEQALRAGLSPSDYVQHLLQQVSDDDDGQQSGLQCDLNRLNKTSDEFIAEALGAVPPAELRKLPVDLADQHDHYVYGTPRKPR